MDNMQLYLALLIATGFNLLLSGYLIGRILHSKQIVTVVTDSDNNVIAKTDISTKDMCR